jgi:hypothetical protein
MQTPALQQPSPHPASAPRVIPPAPPANRPPPPPVTLARLDPLREDIARLEAQIDRLLAIELSKR